MNKQIIRETQGEIKWVKRAIHSAISRIGISVLIVIGIVLSLAGQTPRALAIPAIYYEFSPFYQETSTLRLTNISGYPAMVTAQFRDPEGVYHLNPMYDLGPYAQLDIVGSSLSGLQAGVAYTVIVSSSAPLTGELIESQPKTAEERINSLIDEIKALVDGGMLNKGQGISLIVKLQSALEKLNSNPAVISINMLRAFMNEVLSLTQEGVLTQEVGQALIDEAYNIIEMINN